MSGRRTSPQINAIRPVDISSWARWSDTSAPLLVNHQRAAICLPCALSPSARVVLASSRSCHVSPGNWASQSSTAATPNFLHVLGVGLVAPQRRPGQVPHHPRPGRGGQRPPHRHNPRREPVHQLAGRMHRGGFVGVFRPPINPCGQGGRRRRLSHDCPARTTRPTTRPDTQATSLRYPIPAARLPPGDRGGHGEPAPTRPRPRAADSYQSA